MKLTRDTESPHDMTLLIVDDDAVMRLTLEKVLADKYNVILTENGVQAWETLADRHEEIDVVLTDLEMPLLDGMGLLNRIKSTYPDKCVVVLSGSTDISLAVRAIKKGAHDYIPKPFSNPELLEIIIWRWKQQQSIKAKLSQYAALHKEMMRSMKPRTFMALDVVKSRDLKKDEDPFIVQFSFSAYHSYIAEIVTIHGGAVHSTAGDGVMTCFTRPCDAMTAAEHILDGLDDFNRTDNQLGRDFSLRIGIHSGPVMVDDNGNISEMFSETLDIAGHIQKSGDVNRITVSDATRQLLPTTDRLQPSSESIAGLQLYTYAGTTRGAR